MAKMRSKIDVEREDPDFRDHAMSHPLQLELFEFSQAYERVEGKFSRAMRLWDNINKFFWGKPVRHTIEEFNMEVLPILTREFHHGSHEYRVKIHPAKVEKTVYEKGEKPRSVYRDFYPGKREELVEDALRMLFIRQHGTYLSRPGKEPAASVLFSLHELKKELAQMGHSFSTAEIKEAILICRRTTIEVTTKAGDVIMDSPIFLQVGFSRTQRNAKCYVTFNSLVTRGIDAGAWNIINYPKVMGYRHSFARWLHKRMAINYRYAAPDAPYNLLLTTAIRDSGATAYKEFRNNVRDFEKALKELIEKSVLSRFEKIPLHSAKNKRKVTDVKYFLYAHTDFTSEMKRNNWLKRRVNKQLGS